MTEAELAADRAWWAMLRMIDPMPVGVALDYVQDACGDRDDAVTALLNAAAKRLHDLMPVHGYRVAPVAPMWLLDHLRAEEYLSVEACAAGIEGRNRHMLDLTHDDPACQAEANIAAAWLRWCAYVESDLVRCRAICAAAYPTEAA